MQVWVVRCTGCLRGRTHGATVGGATDTEGLLLVHGLEVLDQVQNAPTLVVGDPHQPLHASGLHFTCFMVCLISSAYTDFLNRLQHHRRRASALALD
jgi:hypothetical protein